MLHFFPTSFLDETLYSRMSRYHRLAGHSCDRTSLHELVEKHTHVITSELPSNLDAFVSKLPPEANVCVEDLVLDNTTFAYFTAFAPAQRGARILAAMRGSSASGIKMLLGLIASRLGGANNLRFCHRCFDADGVAFGQPYWHRVHQLPGVWICPIHEEPLHALAYEAVQLKRHKLLLPDDPYVHGTAEPAAMTSTQQEPLLRIAKLSERTMLCVRPRPGIASIHEVHRLDATQHGLIQSNGRIRVVELIQMLEMYATNLPLVGEYSVLRSRIQDWTLKLLRKPKGKATHPMIHIVLLDCLRGGARLANKTTFAAVLPKHAKPIVEHERISELLTVQKYSLSRAAAILGISTTTAVVAATRAGIKISSRAKNITSEIKHDVSTSLKLGLVPQDVAKRHDISMASVYRILRMDIGLERAYREKRLEIALATYRHMYLVSPSDKAAYAWLRKNDRKWLLEQIRLKKKPRNVLTSVDWALRDKVLSQQIIESDADLRSAHGKPKRISETMLKRLTRMAKTIEKNIGRMPLTQAALSNCAESAATHQSRRLKWADMELRKKFSYPPLRWKLLRLAGVRRLYQQNENLVQAFTSSSVSF